MKQIRNSLWNNTKKWRIYFTLTLVLVLSVITLLLSYNLKNYQQDETQPFLSASNNTIKFSQNIVDNIPKPVVSEISKNTALAANIDKQLYSDEYFVSHSDLRQAVVEYCSETPLNSQIAQSNCNSASKVNQIWYLLAWYASGIINMILSSAILIKCFWIALAIFVPLQILSIIHSRLLNRHYRATSRQTSNQKVETAVYQRSNSSQYR